MAVVAVLRRRSEVEMFKRSVGLTVIGKAFTVTLLFFVVLLAASLALSVTENANGFTMLQIIFEASSALGTVGLSTGITASLTTAGKLIIIAVMFFGRLGPLTLLAALTFNPRPVRYNYPEEAVLVG
jgi:trk system potassium uptake protein TrkH